MLSSPISNQSTSKDTFRGHHRSKSLLDGIYNLMGILKKQNTHLEAKQSLSPKSSKGYDPLNESVLGSVNIDKVQAQKPQAIEASIEFKVRDCLNIQGKILEEINNIKNYQPLVIKPKPTELVIYKHDSLQYSISPLSQFEKPCSFHQANLGYTTSLPSSLTASSDENDRFFGVQVGKEDIQELDSENVTIWNDRLRIEAIYGSICDSSGRQSTIESLKAGKYVVRKAIRNSFKTFNPDKIVENFIIMGAKRKDIAEHVKSLPRNTKVSDSMSFTPSVVYNYAKATKMTDRATFIGSEPFLNPQDMLLTRYNSTNSVAKSIFYKIFLKRHKNYKKRYILPFQPHSTDILLSKWDEYVECINPINKLYAVCIKKRDYIMINLPGHCEEFMTFETVYCMLTYYPIPELCFGLLSSFINLLTVKRRELYLTAAAGDASKTDFSKLVTLLPSYASSYLAHLAQLTVPGPNKTLLHPVYHEKATEHDMMNYQFPDKETSYLELATWGAQVTFSKFSLENLKQILAAILFDKQVIFFSKDISTLTAVTNTFLGMLYPFKLMQVLIPSILPDNDDLFESIMPVIFGVNAREDLFWEKSVISNSNSIFVFIDSRIIFANHNSPDLMNYPKMDFLTQGLNIEMPVTEGSDFDFITDIEILGKIIKRKEGRFEEKPFKDEEVIERIFGHFRKQFKKKVISVLNSCRNLTNTAVDCEKYQKEVINRIPDYEMRLFLTAFTNTQVYCSFPNSVSFPEKMR